MIRLIRGLCITAAILISNASFSQSTQDNSDISTPTDTAYRDGAIFTVAEKMPEVIGGVKVLEDTLTSYLSNYEPHSVLKNVVYKLTITKEGSVRKCVLVNKVKNELLGKRLEDLLKQTSGMWKPAVQNGHLVTAIKTIKINYDNANLQIKELN